MTTELATAMSPWVHVTLWATILVLLFGGKCLAYLTRGWPQWWHNTIIWLANLARPSGDRR